MATRSWQTQSVHDKVVADREWWWRSTRQARFVGANPGTQHDFPCQAGRQVVYPDLVVKLNDGSLVIEEVETEDSVTASEREQWDTFSLIDAAEFRILVPARRSANASILAPAGAHVHIVVFDFLPDGSTRFSSPMLVN